MIADGRDPTEAGGSSHRVALVRAGSAAGGGGAYRDEAIRSALERLATLLEWAGDAGTLSRVLPSGGRVIVKPNWVRHANRGPGGFEPLVTHASLIRAVSEAALAGDIASLTVGDAPLQSCDFPQLLDTAGLDGWAASLAEADPRFRGIADYRRTTAVMQGGVRRANENIRPLDDFVLFDLGTQSLLEPVTGPGNRFRVTQYDPALMARTHGPGRHQYLVARDIIEADLIINLPKLKTHKKAGLTGALKNLIGINGNKEYLPHHRVGGAEQGGDCYPGGSRIKRLLEAVLDRQNAARGPTSARPWNWMTRLLYFAARVEGDELGVEGSWHGNDTIWRTCLDLNRILLYGTAEGRLATTPQRRVIHIVDAIVAGQGDGPLAPLPLPLGLLLGADNAAAVDRVGAALLGYDVDRIPIVRESFGSGAWTIAPFQAADVTLVGDLGEGSIVALEDVLADLAPEIVHPVGWRAAARGIPATR